MPYIWPRGWLPRRSPPPRSWRRGRCSARCPPSSPAAPRGSGCWWWCRSPRRGRESRPATGVSQGKLMIAMHFGRMSIYGTCVLSALRYLMVWGFCNINLLINHMPRGKSVVDWKYWQKLWTIISTASSLCIGWELVTHKTIIGSKKTTRWWKIVAPEYWVWMPKLLVLTYFDSGETGMWIKQI